MHIEYIPENIDFWIHFYKSSIDDHPQFHLGGELPGFRRYVPPVLQRGAGLGSFFKSLYRLALPLFKSAGSHALSAGSKIAADLAEGKDLREVAIKHGREAAGNVLHDAGKKISGKGLGKRKKNAKATIPLKKRRTSKTSSFAKKQSSQAVGSDIFSAQCQSF